MYILSVPIYNIYIYSFIYILYRNMYSLLAIPYIRRKAAKQQSKAAEEQKQQGGKAAKHQGKAAKQSSAIKKSANSSFEGPQLGATGRHRPRTCCFQNPANLLKSIQAARPGTLLQNSQAASQQSGAQQGKPVQLGATCPRSSKSA